MTQTGQRVYIAIDLKSFYGSVECRERGLDPLTTNLVVADASRTEKTICLSVTPSLKAWGISGRARLFEVVQRVREVNEERRRKSPAKCLTGESWRDDELKADPSLAVSYIAAPPRMALYMDYSTRIYSIYLKYIAPEDIHVYSIDEVFMDVTDYLGAFGLSPRELAMRIILDVLGETGITATAGIGPNLYLAKIAMDVMAKRIPADSNGVRIAELDEMSYRQQLWDHRPLTDFWRVGKGYARKLESAGMYTMGDIARCSLGGPGDFLNEDLLYRLFGINAELLIDHAWGWEPVGMTDIKAYRPENSSKGSGQVLPCPYEAEKARIVVREMAENLALELMENGLVTDQIVLTVGYDISNLQEPGRKKAYKGQITKDFYGRAVPKHAHGTASLAEQTASARLITEASLNLYDRIIDGSLLVRRMFLTAGRVMEADRAAKEQTSYVQMDLFTDYAALEKKQEEEKTRQEKEKKLQQAMLDIRRRFGKNAVLKGTDLEEGATQAERNSQIGGHRA